MVLYNSISHVYSRIFNVIFGNKIIFRIQTQDMLTLCAKFCMLKVKKDHKKSTSVLPFNGHLNCMEVKKLPKNISEMLCVLIRHQNVCFQQKIEKKKNSNINDSINTSSMALYCVSYIMLCYRFVTVCFVVSYFITPTMYLYGQFFELPILILPCRSAH